MKLVLAALIANMAAPTLAADLSGFVGITSRYVSRGTDQNVGGDPALLGFATLTTKDGFYVSAFTANMDFGDNTTHELDVFGGKRWTVGKTTVDVGFASINYPNGDHNWDFIEYDIKVDHPIGKGNVGAWVGYTKKYFHFYGPALWTEIHGSYPMTPKITVSGAVANQQLKNNFDYRTWNVGATYSVTPRLSLDVRYSDTDRADLDPIWGTYGARFSTTLTRSF